MACLQTSCSPVVQPESQFAELSVSSHFGSDDWDFCSDDLNLNSWHIVWTSFLQYQSWNDLLHWLNLLRSTVCQTIPYTSPWTRVRPTALAKIINASIEQTKWIHKSRQTVKLFKLSIYSREKEQHEGVFSSLSTFWCDSVSRVVSIFTLRPFQALCLFVLSENM